MSSQVALVRQVDGDVEEHTLTFIPCSVFTCTVPRALLTIPDQKS